MTGKCLEHNMNILVTCMEQLRLGVNSVFYSRVINESFYVHATQIVHHLGGSENCVSKELKRIEDFVNGRKTEVKEKDRDRIYSWIIQKWPNNDRFAVNDCPKPKGVCATSEAN